MIRENLKKDELVEYWFCKALTMDLTENTTSNIGISIPRSYTKSKRKSLADEIWNIAYKGVSERFLTQILSPVLNGTMIITWGGHFHWKLYHICFSRKHRKGEFFQGWAQSRNIHYIVTWNFPYSCSPPPPPTPIRKMDRRPWWR